MHCWCQSIPWLLLPWYCCNCLLALALLWGWEGLSTLILNRHIYLLGYGQNNLTQNSASWTQRTKLRVFYSAPSPQKGRWEGQGARPPTIAIIQYHWNPNNFRMQISQYLLGPKLLQERTLFCGPTKMCTTGLDLLLRHPCESIISKSYRYYGWGRRPSAE